MKRPFYTKGLAWLHQIGSKLMYETLLIMEQWASSIRNLSNQEIQSIVEGALILRMVDKVKPRFPQVVEEQGSKEL